MRSLRWVFKPAGRQGSRRFTKGFAVSRVFLRFFLLCSLVLVARPAQADCTLSALGNTPLTDMPLGQLYQGFDGGLYPGWENQPPPEQLMAAIAAAGQVQPIGGRFVILGIGQSNANNEFSKPPPPPRLPAIASTYTFKTRMDLDPSKNPELLIVDASKAAGASSWADASSSAWAFVDTVLQSYGVIDPNEVQVAWIKLTELSLVGSLFPAHALLQLSYLKSVVQILKTRFPNAKLVFLSSRTRAYTVDTGPSFEPYAYENGFAIKWLIESQLYGDPGLNFDPANGPVMAPVMLWGPYLWADGATPRSDGLQWICDPGDPVVTPTASDVRAYVSTNAADYDYTHPGGGGIYKVASQLIAFFKTHPAAAPWFLKPSGAPPAVSIAATGATTGTAPLTVTFDATDLTPGQTVVEYAWNFDDGTNSIAASAVKTFVTPGVFTVRMTATDVNGDTVTHSIDVTVAANCSNPFTPSGTPCDDGDACSQIDVCVASACVGTSLVSCAAPGACQSSSCDPATGACVVSALVDGAPCSDGNLCTLTDTCVSGACSGANPKSCVAADECHDEGVCYPPTGACTSPVKANGSPCDDGNGCTAPDTCQAGACVSGPPVECPAPGPCQLAGTCDPQAGACQNLPVQDGTACDDGDACTEGDTCGAGACAGSTIGCPTPDECHSSAGCDPTSGVCSETEKADGTPCSAGTCQAGQCLPGSSGSGGGGGQGQGGSAASAGGESGATTTGSGAVGGGGSTAASGASKGDPPDEGGCAFSAPSRSGFDARALALLAVLLLRRSRRVQARSSR